MSVLGRHLPVAITLAIGLPSARAEVTTVLPATPSVAMAREAYGAKFTFHFDAFPTSEECNLRTTILNEKGEPVGGGLVQLPSTHVWKGKVDVSRWVGLPDRPPINGKTGEALPDGTYSLWLNLAADGKPNEPLTPGPGVEHTAQWGYRVAIIKIDHAAPLPELGPKALDLTGYHITFEDQFNDLSVSAAGPCGAAKGESRWMSHTPSHGDFGDAHFQDPKPDFPFTTINGILSIHVRQTEKDWQGGLLSSVDYDGHGFSQKFGYFEMRAKLAKGTGTWPAFWLLSQPGVGHPELKTGKGCEVDVLEQYGHWPNVLNTTTHIWPRDGTPHTATFEAFVVPGMTDDFHTYGVMFTESKLTYYYDGTILREEPTPEPAKVPMYILLNYTLGPGWPLDQTPKESAMQVDYVRAYGRNDKIRNQKSE